MRRQKTGTRCCFSWPGQGHGVSLSLLMLISLGLVLFPSLKAAEVAKTGADPMPTEGRLLIEANKIPELMAQKKLYRDAIPNPHWRDDACHACHRGGVGEIAKKPVKLRERRADKVCYYCHDARYEHSYIHPVDIKPDAAMIARMPPAYQRSIEEKDGFITCLTCHDLPKQCLTERRSQKGLNPAFFRGGPFRVRSKQCYFCHDAKQYERLNPHDQVDDNGRLREKSCGICHSDPIGTLRAVQGIVNLNFGQVDDLSLLCIRCHQVQPHPNVTFKFGAEQEPPNHLVKPSKKKLRHMQEQTKIKGVELPLEPGTGKIFCGTCHNPHEKGAVKRVEGKIGAGNRKKRLRADKICQLCHDV